MANNLPAIIESSAKAQGLMLSEVNLIMPTETFGSVLGQFDKVTIETVRINTEDSREVYEPNGKGKGFAPGKVSLQKIAAALSIQWHPQLTGIVESTPTKSRAKAVGMMRKPNGEIVTQSEEKTIDIQVDEEDLRDKAEKDAAKGNPDGQVTEWGETTTGKKYPKAYTPWRNDTERKEWVDNKVRDGIKQRRRFKDELALTGAKDRVIRSFLALKSTYTAEELAKPLAFPRVSVDASKLLDDPRTRQFAANMLAQSTSALYGTQPEAETFAPEETTGAEPKTEVRNVTPKNAPSFDPDEPAEQDVQEPSIEVLKMAALQDLLDNYSAKLGANAVAYSRQAIKDQDHEAIDYCLNAAKTSLEKQGVKFGGDA